ncbi:MAG: RNA 2',3'-cyclic phosphodiesterase [Thermoguttaceae bacterium]
MKNTVRTFVAVEIDSAIRSQIGCLIELLRDSGADVKWVDPKNQHLTLKFLGDVASGEIPRVCEMVQQAATGVKPFELEIRGAGAFPNASRLRTLWLGSGQGEEEMIDLQGRIDKQLGKLSFRPDRRRFHPHLTIGRVRRGGPGLAELAKMLAAEADFAAGTIKVNKVLVFSSQLQRDGPIYEVLATARLSGK